MPPFIDLGGVGGKNDERWAGELYPRLFVGGRDRRQNGNIGVNCRVERIQQASPTCFKLTKLTQDDKVASRRNISSHRFGCGEHPTLIKMAIRRPRPEILEDRKPFASVNVSQESCATSPVGKTMGFREDACYAGGRPPPINQRPEHILDRRVWRPLNHSDHFYRSSHLAVSVFRRHFSTVSVIPEPVLVENSNSDVLETGLSCVGLTSMA